MNKVIIALNGQTPEEIEKVDGVIHGIPWDALVPTISQHVRLRPDEILEGLIIDDANIRVKIGRKRKQRTTKIKDNTLFESNPNSGPEYNV